MKHPSPLGLLFVSAALATSASAALTLTDGRSFQDASVMSQTPRTVVIRHSDGLTSVSKNLLPPELATHYPLDEAAALEADRRAAEARVRADAFHQAEAERSARIRLEREKSAYYTAALDAAERRAEAAEAELDRRPVVYQDSGYFSPFYRHDFGGTYYDYSNTSALPYYGYGYRKDRDCNIPPRVTRCDFSPRQIVHRHESSRHSPRTNVPRIQVQSQSSVRTAAVMTRR